MPLRKASGRKTSSRKTSAAGKNSSSRGAPRKDTARSSTPATSAGDDSHRNRRNPESKQPTLAQDLYLLSKNLRLAQRLDRVHNPKPPTLVQVQSDGFQEPFPGYLETYGTSILHPTSTVGKGQSFLHKDELRKSHRARGAAPANTNRQVETVPEVTYEDLETLWKGRNQDYNARMEDFIEELHMAAQPLHEPAPDFGGPPIEDVSTPIRPKLPDDDIGGKTPARPPIPLELPRITNISTGRKRRPNLPPPSPPMGPSPPRSGRKRSPIPQPARNSPVPQTGGPVTVVEIPHCRSNPNSPGVQWPLPPNIPVGELVSAYSTVMDLVRRGMELSSTNIEDSNKIPKEDKDSTWTFHNDRFEMDDNNEIMELVNIYGNAATGDIPWEIIGAEMRSLTTKPIENQYQLLLSTGLEMKPYTREEDLTILRLVVENPTARDMYYKMMEAIEELGTIRSIRSVMRRLLILIGCHHHPQSDEMQARNNLKEAMKMGLNADQKNLLIELRKQYSKQKDWAPLGRLFGMTPSALQRLYDEGGLANEAPAQWDDYEDKKLKAAVKYLGEKWQEIAVMMRRRSPDNCRKRFEKLKKKASK